MKSFWKDLIAVLCACLISSAVIAGGIYNPPAGGSGSGTVTSFSCVTANGVSCSVATATTTPAATFTLGAITPTTVNGLTISTSTGTLTIANSKVLTASNTLTLTGTDGSTAAFGAGGTVAYTNVNQSWTAGQAVTPTASGTQSAAGTLTPDWSASNSTTFTFGAGNLTIANPTNVKAGQNYQIKATQDGTGGRSITWGGNFKWSGGTPPTLTVAANAIDIISCWADTTTTLNCTLAIANSK